MINLPKTLIGTPYEHLPWEPIESTPQECFNALVLYADGTIGFGNYSEYYTWHWRVETSLGDPDPRVRSSARPIKGPKIAFARLPEVREA